jgi:hypothetical protein
MHIDPLGTSAWNTVLKGLKLWVLFPPNTEKRVVKGLDVIKKGEDDEAVNYFVDLVPRIKEKHPEVDIRLFLQAEGETVFVPGGWWHAVINLEDSIAITQVRPPRTIAIHATSHHILIMLNRTTTATPISSGCGSALARAARRWR